MKAIYDFVTIQVELTNACIHTCSNCTRFCGHHKKPFFMDWPTFQRAVDSLKDWPRHIGIMGGEPTMHPDFERFVEYAHSVHAEPYRIGGGLKPTASLSEYLEDANIIKSGLVNKLKGLGLWSSVCSTYAKHYEIIQDNFIFQCINDHTASSRHQAWLMTRKEFGVSDSDWARMRDNCWWQRLLGAPSITPKGAFFCEVAAAMDMLFDGPGGWKIEKGWWKRPPEDYKEQLMWCEYCSGAFCDLDRDANESRDDVSPVLLRKLEEIGSPKIKNGNFVLHNPGDKEVVIKPRNEMLMYQDDYSLRVTEKNKYIRIDNVSLLFGTGLGKKIISSVKRNKSEWLLYFQQQSPLCSDFDTALKKATYNPGTLHYFEEYNAWLFNTAAQSIRNMGMDGLSSVNTIDDLRNNWIGEKIVSLEKGFENIINPDIEEWRQNIIQSGLMKHYRLDNEFNSVAYRSTVFPQIDAIVKSGATFFNKMEALSNVATEYVISALLASKTKTAIHNCLAQFLRDNRFDFDRVKRGLMEADHNYCANYALAMLLSGEEKRTRLIRCISDNKNLMGLGVAALKDDYLYPNQSGVGIAGELVRVLKPEPVILYGYRYPGMSVQMFASNANLPVACFADEERHGHTYNGVTVYRLNEAAEKYPAAPVLICHEAADEKLPAEQLASAKASNKIISMNQSTFLEMKRSPDFSNAFLRELRGHASTDSGKWEALLKNG